MKKIQAQLNILDALRGGKVKLSAISKSEFFVEGNINVVLSYLGIIYKIMGRHHSNADIDHVYYRNQTNEEKLENPPGSIFGPSGEFVVGSRMVAVHYRPEDNLDLHYDNCDDTFLREYIDFRFGRR